MFSVSNLVIVISTKLINWSASAHLDWAIESRAAASSTWQYLLCQSIFSANVLMALTINEMGKEGDNWHDDQIKKVKAKSKNCQIEAYSEDWLGYFPIKPLYKS